MNGLASRSQIRGSRYLGAVIPGSITYATPDTSRRYHRAFIAGQGTVESVGVYLKQTVANVWGGMNCGIFENDSGEPGKMIGLYIGDVGPTQVLFNTVSAVPRWVDFPCSADIRVPGTYWAMWWIQDAADITYATDATAGAGTGNSGYQSAGANWIIEKGASGYTWTATANVENIIRVLHRS